MEEDPLLLEKEVMWKEIPNYLMENPMDRGTWRDAVHGVTKSRTQLSDFTYTFHFPWEQIQEMGGA